MNRHRGGAAGRDRYRSISPDPHHHFSSSKYYRGRVGPPEPPLSASDELNYHHRRHDFNDSRHHRRGSPGRRDTPPLPPPPAPAYNNSISNYRESPGRRRNTPPPPPPAYNNSMDNYRGGDRDRDRDWDRDRDRDRERDREYRRAVAFDSLPPPPPPPRRYSPLRAGGGKDGGYFHAMSPLSGQKRDFSSFSDGTRGPLLPPPPPVAVSERNDGASFPKLFIGSVPRTVTEEDIRPVFDKHGRVIEVALIRDKRTGQQQGCCFVKYATSQEADIAIKMLHNQYTLPGGSGPIQVRYADGERERLGTAEFKLFVGSLNKHATEKEVEQIFAPYGQVEDVYLMRDEMRLSRGCGFVKYKYREMALAAINALSGRYTMTGCDNPITVRFADPKRPKPGESRGGNPVLGGPGLGPRLTSPSIRPPLIQGEPMHDRFPQNDLQPMSPQKPGLPNSGLPGFGSHFQPRPADMPNYGQSLPPMPTVGQHISPLQKPLQSPPRLPFSLQLQPPNAPSFVQLPISHPMIRPVSQAMFPGSGGQNLNQPLPSQQLPGSGRHFPVSQPQVPLNVSSSLDQGSRMSNLQSHITSAGANQLQLPAQQQSLQPPQQSPSHLAQLLSQQRQTLQASFQSSQQAVSQLQQQLQLRQASNQSSMPPQGPLPAKDQSQWSGTAPQAAGTASTVQPGGNVPATLLVNSATPSMTSDVALSKCNWTEHTSPDGYKYYYNSTTGESKWDKPKELEMHEQQQQQKPLVPYPQMQHFQSPPVQIVPQRQTQVQNQSQMQQQPHHRPQQQQPQSHPQQLQQSFPSSVGPGVAGHQNVQEFRYTQPPVVAGPKSTNDLARFQQVQQPAQDWKWKNNPPGM